MYFIHECGDVCQPHATYFGLCTKLHCVRCICNCIQKVRSAIPFVYATSKCHERHSQNAGAPNVYFQRTIGEKKLNNILAAAGRPKLSVKAFERARLRKMKLDIVHSVHWVNVHRIR